MQMPARWLSKKFCLERPNEQRFTWLWLPTTSCALHLPNSLNSYKYQQVFDVADNEIVKRLEAGDLVITGDIPLAAEVIENNAIALNPRGELYTVENIKERLTMRDFMETLRSSGIDSSGPAPLSHKHRQNFANNLDRILSQG